MKQVVVTLGVLGVLAAVVGVGRAQQPGGGPGGPPQPGQVLPGFAQERLNLTAEQKKQVEELQQELDAKLAKILTAEQQKALQEMRQQPFGGPGGPGFGRGPGPGGNGPFPAFGGFGGGFGPNGGLDGVKKQLGASDEEWKVIGPKLQKVIAARQVIAAANRGAEPGFGGAFFGGPGGAFGGPGAGPGGGPMPTSAVSQAQSDLKTLLNDPKHTPTEVQEKVVAVRKARQKARADVDAAEKDLLQMLTAEQEAVLVSLGYLD